MLDLYGAGEFGVDDYGTTQSVDDGGNFVSDIADSFFSTARDRLGDALSSFSMDTGAQTGPTIGSQLFEAIYQFGRGKIDAAREKAVGAFLMTSEGQKLQAEGVRQTAVDYAPVIILALVGLLLLGLFIGKK